MTFSAKFVGRLAGPILFALILMFFHPSGLSPEANAVLAATAWIAVWWVTEAIPIAATALLPIVLFSSTGAVDLQATTSQYGHRYIFLYIGGFLIAIAIEKWGLHRRIALNIINLIGTNITSIILGFMVATAGLSMWISNTATAVMMLPIGMAIVAQLRDNPQTEAGENETFGKALMLAIAYSASIGGIATLIGTPPNLVLAGVVEEVYGVEISFLQWFKFGLPISLILLALCWVYLTRFAFQFRQKSFPGGRQEIQKQLHALKAFSREEKLLLGVFSLTAAAWISRSFLQQQLGLFPRLDDTIIAMTGGLCLFLIPSGNVNEDAKPLPLLDWEDTKNLPWGIVLLFGGGMALAEGFTSSGLAVWIGSQTTLLESVSMLLLVLILVAAVNFLTEITSNLATTSMLLPILASMAVSMNVHPFLLMVGATVAASCAFMLPVATPPNAVVFGSGHLRIPDMVRVGIWLNVISIVLLTVFVYWVLPIVWDIQISEFPDTWR
ncbi:Sodium-dependent dicarboxylate transporter SdcS [Stieleria maiorica]|uniref:Sodium-dependent dicarboxylate transporter SdcS n=1 Tax=Stieleria maiorica TaxID=2795974 RepID=A0A5B9MGY9_9BACT|nr:SLC13 family permease [Stieleria maiorica]QEF98347.1 Sodium-dependent dicarboxylate transporter SdcS [Stieleria maiorica]